jgi:hypothetical protein
MSTALELVYEYRALLGKSRGGAGLTLDEIETVEAIEGLFAVGAMPATCGGVVATLRGGPKKMTDQVELSSIGLERVLVKVGVFLEPGAPVELQVEDDELRLSYRFPARVTSIHGDPLAAAHEVSIELVGIPLLIRRGPKIDRPNAKSLPPRSSSEPRVVAA